MNAQVTLPAGRRRFPAGGTPARRRTVAFVVSDRSGAVRTAPVVEAMRLTEPSARHVVINARGPFEGTPPPLEDVFAVPECARFLGLRSGRNGEETARAGDRIGAALREERADLVVLAGDSDLALAAALAASRLGVPVAHLEAGLRSFRWSRPEEVNRHLVDRSSRWCVTHWADAAANLEREGFDEARILRAGNTLVDVLVRLDDRLAGCDIVQRLGLRSHDYLLLALDGPAPPAALLARLERALPVIELPDSLSLTEALTLQRHAAGVLTDVGDVQEAATFFRIPCFTPHDVTERPPTVSEGTNRLLGTEPEAILALPGLIEDAVPPLTTPAGWDGRAGERIAAALGSALAARWLGPATRGSRVAGR